MRRPPFIALVAGLAAALLSLLIAPDPPELGNARGGDRALGERVLEMVAGDTGGYRGLSVAFIDRGRVSSALLGDPAGGPLFEIGSVQKTMTGMLLADLSAAGVVDPQDTLGETLPAVKLGDPTASITLEELASQRSGLPRVSPDRLAFARSLLTNVNGGNPYAGADVGALFDSAAGAEPGDDRGEVGYSNFGMALLGQALAVKAGTTYQQLVTDRILRPLGMSSTYPLPADPAPPGLARGTIASGLDAEPWTSAGYAPAGAGPRSTAEDLARLVSATMAGTAPGADAARPRFDGDADGERIGYAWFTDRYGDRDITWHNGSTGGFRSYVGFDRSTGQGVVVLGNTDRPVEWIGLSLLGAEVPAGLRSASPGLPRIAIGLVLLGYGALALLLLAVVRKRSIWLPEADRLRVVGSTVSTVAVLLVVHRVGAWLILPPWLWSLAVGGAAAGLAALLLRWRGLPVIADGRPAVRRAGTAVSLAVSAVVLWLIV
ncbi:serine hydrolase domain-containing protein [Actinoplanes sp. NPDC051633]|uniref:serine hydrolase domain-containing protein n=1 Tax=Actinoplanes sp. NPDC051633 TaxID=3155670 RepID=UPI003439AE63